MTEVFKTIAVWLVFAMVPFATVFPIVYSRRPWRSTQQGKAIMLLMFSLALLVDFGVLFQFLPRTPLRFVVADIVYGLLLASFIRLTVVLWRTPHSRRSS